MTTHPAVQKPQSAATRVWPMRCKRMQILLVAHAFDGENLLAHGFGRQGVAGIERRAVHQHAAGAATGAIAAPVGARQAQLHRNHFPQRGARFVFGGVRLAVDEERCFFIRHRRSQRKEEAAGAANSDSAGPIGRSSTTPDPAALRKFLRE